MEHVEPAKPKVEFTADGVLKSAELKIMNLRPGVGNSLVWEEVSISIHVSSINIQFISQTLTCTPYFNSIDRLFK